MFIINQSLLKMHDVPFGCIHFEHDIHFGTSFKSFIQRFTKSGWRINGLDKAKYSTPVEFSICAIVSGVLFLHTKIIGILLFNAEILAA